MRHITTALTVVLFVALPRTTAAQTGGRDHRFELLGQFAGVRSNEFAGTDRGVGGLFAWHRLDPLDIEGEVNFYPKNLTANGGAPFSRGRVEGLIGITVGPILGHIRPFGTFRTGFVTFQSAPSPLVCPPAINPPTLPCALAKGETVIAGVVAGGFEVFPNPHAVVRIELGDRLTNYPAAIDASGEAHSMAFWSNEFRFVAGAGVRF